MSREGAIIFGDLIGKLPVLQVSCTKCPRRGRYILARLLRAHGPNSKVIDWARRDHRRGPEEVCA